MTTNPAMPELNPADIVVDVVCKAMGGFALGNTSGVRVTHKPSGVSVIVDSERSQHKNKHLALEKLRAVLAALQAQPAEVSDAEINRIACKAGFSAVDVEVNGRAFARFARALRPQASPRSALMAEHREYIDGYRAGVEDGQRLGPQAVPMTDEQVKAARRSVCDDPDELPEPLAFRMGIYAAEAHHGITAPAGGEKQA